MRKRIHGYLLAAIFIAYPLFLFADEGSEAVQAALQKWAPEVQPQSIEPTPVPGIYEVVLEGQVLYLSKDGHYALQGQLVDLTTHTNLTEERLKGMRATALNALDEQNMIVFSPKEAKYTVNVFTDIDCGYCRQLHQQIDAYNERGIKIRYLAFPRAGIGSSSYDKAVQVWCAEDRQQAITQAKAGKAVKGASDCESPVAEQFELGQSLGVNATPTLVLEDGAVLPGFIRPQALANFLEQKVAVRP